MPHPLHHLHTDEGDDDGAPQNKGKARILRTEDIEKALDAEPFLLAGMSTLLKRTSMLQGRLRTQKSIVPGAN
jgi:hypothetical protein